MIETFSPVMSNPELTEEHLARAERYLCETRDTLVACAAGLSAAQWNFKPAPDRWSIGEIIEHLDLIENRVHGIIAKMSEAPLRQHGVAPAQTDELIVTEIPKRSARFEAPEWVRPTNSHKDSKICERFVASRKRTIELLSASPLRGHVVMHPIMGPWDGYQWLLAAAAHSARHTDQIREVKADPDFPQSSVGTLITES